MIKPEDIEAVERVAEKARKMLETMKRIDANVESAWTKVAEAQELARKAWEKAEAA